MTQLITATSLIEKEPMNTQVGLFLDKWNSSGYFDQKDNCYLTFHYCRNWSAELFHSFLAPLAVGQRPYVMVFCPLCVRLCVRPSVRGLTFSLNISETTYRILMKFHRNVPAMVLFRISWTKLIPSKTVVAMATKLKKNWKLWKSSCQEPYALELPNLVCSLT